MNRIDIQLICFDLNKTLIHENSWLDLNLAMGMTAEEDDVLFHLANDEIIDFAQWLQIATRIYQKRGNPTQENIEKVLFNYQYIDGAADAVKCLLDKGYKVALISGSFNLLVARIARELSIPLFGATYSLVFNQEGVLEEIVSMGDEEQAKLKILEDMCNRLGISITDCACVGDGDNDLAMFQKTGHGITFTGTAIAEYAEHTIDTLIDLCELF